jgi:AraC-like DNA-binding protein
MTKAKMIIRENLYAKITPEEIAEQLNMSYSWFRKTFKDFYRDFSCLLYSTFKNTSCQRRIVD